MHGAPKNKALLNYKIECFSNKCVPIKIFAESRNCGAANAIQLDASADATQLCYICDTSIAICLRINKTMLLHYSQFNWIYVHAAVFKYA